jgi:hypothetical protein
MTTSPQENGSESAHDAEGTDVGGQAGTTESGVEESVTDDGGQVEEPDSQGKNPL